MANASSGPFPVTGADDILVLTPTQEEAQQAWTDLREMLLPAGMPLKGTPTTVIRNLSTGEHADWLGFRITLESDNLEVRLTERSWNSLRQQLDLTHIGPDSPLRAVMVITGWVDQLGPCYPGMDRQTVYARLESMAQELAFDEVPDPGRTGIPVERGLRALGPDQEDRCVIEGGRVHYRHLANLLAIEDKATADKTLETCLWPGLDDQTTRTLHQDQHAGRWQSPHGRPANHP